MMVPGQPAVRDGWGMKVDDYPIKTTPLDDRDASYPTHEVMLDFTLRTKNPET
jgi:hypothetical protein